MARENTPTTAKQWAPQLPSLVTKPRKAALLIGCKYKDNKDYATLENTHRDVLALKDLLIDVYHYDKANITVLLDDGHHEAPTRANIEREMKKLVSCAKAGDKHFFHFSGHGEQTPCHPDDNSEPDGMDEAIVPCDAVTEKKETWIIDNDMNKILVRRIPINAQLIAFFDMCHSGTALDLTHYCYNGTVSSFIRTSHDKVVDESRRLSELPTKQGPIDGDSTSTPDATQRKNVRRFSYTTRKNTIICEFSEGLDASGTTISNVNGETARVDKVIHRGNTCAECGGLLGGLEQPEGHDRPGFVPSRPEDSLLVQQRPVPQRESAGIMKKDDIVRVEEQQVSANESEVPRRHSYTSPHEREFGCLSAFNFDWLSHFVRTKFSLSRVDNGEKAHEDGREAPARRSSTTSLTPLRSSSAPASRLSPSSSSGSIHAPTPRREFFSCRATAVVAAPSLKVIREDSQASKFLDGEFVWCNSPPPLSPTSPTGSVALEVPTGSITSSGSANVAQQLPPSGGTQTRKKCNCRVRSGWQGGQVITIAGASDFQLAWDTKELGSLTAAFVAILRKDAHPTYRTLLCSIQHFLNNVSDYMRKQVVHDKHRMMFKKHKKKAKKQRQQQQQPRHSAQHSQATRAPASSTAPSSASTSRRTSNKSDAGIGIFEMADALNEYVQGGPWQDATLGSEIRFDPRAKRFEP